MLKIKKQNVKIFKTHNTSSEKFGGIFDISSPPAKNLGGYIPPGFTPMPMT